MNRSTPGLPVHHQLPEFTQTQRPSSRWCHPAISSSVIPFSSCPQSLPASGSFPMSQLFAWGGQSTWVSALASLLPINTQDWSPLWWTAWTSLQSKGLSRVFSNTTVQYTAASLREARGGLRVLNFLSGGINRDATSFSTFVLYPWMIYCGPWLGNCRYQKIYSLVAIVVWLQDMFTSCPSYESMKMGWEVLAKLKVPVEVKKNNTSSYLEIKLKVQLCTLQVLSQVNPLFPHHIQTHTIYFSLVFWDTFFKIIYSEESQEHMNRQIASHSFLGHTVLYIYLFWRIPGTHGQKWQV